MLTMAGDWKLLLLAGIGGAVISTTAAMAVARKVMKMSGEDRRKPEKWIKVGTVKEFRIYPVKSCQGISVEEATATKIGFQSSEFCRDRVFMVVTPEGVLVRQSDEPTMALIGVALDGNKVTLSAPGLEDITFEIPEDQPDRRRTCTIWGETVNEALDCGPQVSEWFKEYLGRDLHLFYHFRDVTCRPNLTPDHQRFSTFSVEDKGTFQDDTSYMFTTQESLDEVNRHLESPVTHLRFRPNIAIEGTPEAYSEDNWGYVRIGGEGGPIFKVAQPCLRCRLTMVDPEQGKMDPKGFPLTTLHKLKHNLWSEELRKACKGKAIFGCQLGLYEHGKNVKKGDPVHVALL